MSDLGSKLFLAKEFTDLKIICNEKQFECHKSVLACQSDVFGTMFLNEEMAIGQIEINDISAETMETFLYYLYHQEVKEKLVDANLLFAAEKVPIKYYVSKEVGAEF